MSRFDDPLPSGLPGNRKVHIPDRLTEGYGPSRAGIEALKAEGVRLLLTLDCGVGAHETLMHAARLGLETVIVDHHLAGSDLPPAFAIINPNRQDDLSGQGHLCAAGLTWILAAATNRTLRLSEFSPIARSRIFSVISISSRWRLSATWFRWPV